MASPLPDSLKNFGHKFPLRKISKGQMVLYQGEVPRSGYLVTKGTIKSFGISSLGEERVVTYYTEGDLFPVAWLFDKAPVALFYYSAYDDCEVRVLPRDDTRKLILINEKLRDFLLDKYLSLYVGMSLHIHALENSRAQDKLLRTLQYLIMRFGTRVKPNLHKIDLRLTQQDLANMVGLSRETTAIEVVKLRKRGVLSYHNQFYTIHTDKMLRMLGEEEFTDVIL